MFVGLWIKNAQVHIGLINEQKYFEIFYYKFHKVNTQRREESIYV